MSKDIKVEIKKLEKSLVEISGEIPEDKFSSYRARALKNMANNVEIDGFRKGMAPELVLVKKFGDMAILEEMAHLALSDVYPEIVTKNELDVIGHPEISITKIAKGSPLGFKIKSAVVPEIELPNYKKIAKEEMAKTETVTVEDKEVDDTIEEVRKGRAVKKEGDKEGVMPELNDEFAKSLGDFKNVEELKAKIKENLKTEKELKLKDKKRITIIEKIVAEMKVELPEIIIDSETEKLLFRMKSDVERLGLKFDEYLKNLKKTEDDFKKEWRGEGEKRAKIELALGKIAQIENIKPEEEEIQKEIGHVLDHYKDAKEERVRDYVANLLTNEKVFQFLEGQK